MTDELDKQLAHFFEEMVLEDESYFYDQIDILVAVAKEIAGNIPKGATLSTPKINKELQRVESLTSKFQEKVGSLNFDVAFLLDSEHNMENKPLSANNEPIDQAITRILDELRRYCKQAKERDKEHLRYKDIECELLRLFEYFGGKVTKSENGTFATLLKFFRRKCKIRGFSEVHVNAVYISRLLEYRDSKLQSQNSS